MPRFPRDQARLMWLEAMLELSAAFMSPAIDKLRLQGRLGLLAEALMLSAWNETCRGHWNLALAAAEEAQELAKESSQPFWEAGASVIRAVQAALRGDIEKAAVLTSEAEPLAAA